MGVIIEIVIKCISINVINHTMYSFCVTLLCRYLCLNEYLNKLKIPTHLTFRHEFHFIFCICFKYTLLTIKRKHKESILQIRDKLGASFINKTKIISLRNRRISFKTMPAIYCTQKRRVNKNISLILWCRDDCTIKVRVTNKGHFILCKLNPGEVCQRLTRESRLLLIQLIQMCQSTQLRQ